MERGSEGSFGIECEPRAVKEAASGRQQESKEERIMKRRFKFGCALSTVLVAAREIEHGAEELGRHTSAAEAALSRMAYVTAEAVP